MDILKTTRYQRWMLVAILLCIIGQLALIFGPSLILGGRDVNQIPPAEAATIGLMYLGLMACVLLIEIFVLVSVILLSSAIGNHVLVTVLVALLMFVPLVNLLTLLILNAKATRILRAAGLHVGLMGVSPRQLPG